MLLLGIALSLYLLLPQAALAQRGDIDWNGWQFEYEIGVYHDGLAIFDVSFQGERVMGRGSFPSMPTYYENNSCGPFLDRLDSDVAQVPWSNFAYLVSREFTVNGEQWYELGIRELLGNYDLYQVWYFNGNGVVDAHLFARGIQCIIDHEHWPHWRLDIDADGPENDQILRLTANGLQPYQTEFNVPATDAMNHAWFVRDTVTGGYVRIDFDSGAWNVPGNVVPEAYYAKNRVIGRTYKGGEEGWHYTEDGSLPANWNNGVDRVGYGDDETINNADTVFWYSGYFPHLATEASSLWHSTGVRLTVMAAGLNIVNPGDQKDTLNQFTALSLAALTELGTNVSFSASGLPPGLTLNSNTGRISGRPSTPGLYNIIATVTSNGTGNGTGNDAGNGAGGATTTFSWAIQNNPPQFSTPSAQTFIQWRNVSLVIDAADPDNDALTFSADNLPHGLTINPNSGRVTGAATKAGAYDVLLTVDDNSGNTISTSVVWLVKADSDRDGMPNDADDDDDNDGIADIAEVGPSYSLTTPRTRVPETSRSLLQLVDLSDVGALMGDSVSVSSVVAAGDLAEEWTFFSLDINDGEFQANGLRTGVECGNLRAVSPAVATDVTVIDINSDGANPVPGISIEAMTSTFVSDLPECDPLEYQLTLSGLSADLDEDGVGNLADLDSDGDSIPDVVEAGLTDGNGNFLVDTAAGQGSVVNPPDTDNDGIPDYLDLESRNPNNDDTDYDLDRGPFASFDTNNDGVINRWDGPDGGRNCPNSRCGEDVDGDGIDDSIDGNRDFPGMGQPPLILGDVTCNNDVDAVDALAVLQFTIALRTDTGTCPLNAPTTTLNASMADVKPDGLINAVDALFILQCEVNIANAFCPE